MPAYEEFSGRLDNHLIITNGVISGDFALQCYQDTDKMRGHMAPAADHPVLGSAAYRRRACRKQGERDGSRQSAPTQGPASPPGAADPQAGA